MSDFIPLATVTTPPRQVEPGTDAFKGFVGSLQAALCDAAIRHAEKKPRGQVALLLSLMELRGGRMQFGLVTNDIEYASRVAGGGGSADGDESVANGRAAGNWEVRLSLLPGVLYMPAKLSYDGTKRSIDLSYIQITRMSVVPAVRKCSDLLLYIGAHFQKRGEAGIAVAEDLERWSPEAVQTLLICDRFIKDPGGTLARIFVWGDDHEVFAFRDDEGVLRQAGA